MDSSRTNASAVAVCSRGAAQFETNESLGLTLRSQLGGMIGARLVNTNRAGMQVGAGLVGNRELGVDVPATTNLEGLIALSGSYYTSTGRRRTSTPACSIIRA